MSAGTYHKIHNSFRRKGCRCPDCCWNIRCKADKSNFMFIEPTPYEIILRGSNNATTA